MKKDEGGRVKDEKYPWISAWVVDGEISIGQTDSYSDATAMVLDHGGTAWQTSEEFATMDDLFATMEREIGLWCKEQGIELIDRNGNEIPFPD